MEPPPQKEESKHDTHQTGNKAESYGHYVRFTDKEYSQITL